MELSSMFQTSFLLKGGHNIQEDNAQRADDVLCCGGSLTWFPGERIDNTNTHGTGCTYSAAIAAYLARGCATSEAVERAKQYLTGAIQHCFPLGAGHGPLNHFWRTDA